MHFEKQKRNFSEAARAAGIAKRRQNAAEREPRPPHDVFVTRLGTAYGWEIRRFGSITLAKSDVGFETHDEARMAGEASMITMGS